MCNCPIDWVACFNSDCERAEPYRESLRLAQEAFDRMQARENEDVAQWAQTLASDLSKFKD